jgi:hypothetical protein
VTLKVNEVEALLESYEQDYEGGWYWWKYESNRDEGVTVTGLGKVWVVEEIGGGEGGGEDMSLVLRVRDETGKYPTTRYFQKNGYYASFGGSSWDGSFVEVQPVSRTVTLFEEVRR